MPSGSPLVAVTGATGELGKRIASRLASRGASQRIIVRDSSRAPNLGGRPVEVAIAKGSTIEIA